VFLLSGVAKYLFSPLSLAVLLSLLASLVLSFTVVPVMFAYLMKSQKHGHEHGREPDSSSRRNPFSWTHYEFNKRFDQFRNAYRNVLAWAIGAPWVTAAFFGILMIVSLALFPLLGRDFFPSVDAGQMRLHVRAPAGSRIETTGQYFAAVEKAAREIIGKGRTAA
jgi:multidrug efflux pump subunit AcrB